MYFRGMYLTEPGTLVLTANLLRRNWKDWVTFRRDKGWLRVGPLNLNWRWA